MITPEEKEEIINKAVEKALLMLPEVVGSMMAGMANENRIRQDFFSKYPEFKAHLGAVASVVEMVEGKNPTDKYEDILVKSVPEIRKRIEQTKGLDINSISKPMLDASNIHGEI